MQTIAEIEARIRFHESVAQNARDMRDAATFEMRDNMEEAKKLRSQLAARRRKD